MNRPSRWAVNLGLVALSVVTTLLLVEIGLRLAAEPERANARVTHARMLVQHDTLFGWVKVPGASTVHRSDEYEAFERINSVGIRGPDYPREKPAGVFRIVVLGDSFAEGYTVDLEDLFSEVLQRELVRVLPDRAVEVINLGTGGYSTDQEYLAFLETGRHYDPDLTVLVFVPNDVMDNTRERSWRGFKPRFLLEDGELALTGVPVPEPRPAVRVEGTEDAEGLEALKGWMWARSKVYRLVSDRIKRVHGLHQLAIRLGVAEPPAPEPEGGPGIPPVLRPFRLDYDEEDRSAWRLTEALLGALDREVTAAGSDFMILYAPLAATVEDQRWAATLRQYGLERGEWNRDRPAEVLAELATRIGIDFVDPSDAFRRSVASGGPRLYWERDGHWNVEGNRAAGMLLADHIGAAYLGAPP